MFPIRSVVESDDDGVIYQPKPVVYITWKSTLIGAGVGVFGATFQVRMPMPEIQLRVSEPVARPTDLPES